MVMAVVFAVLLATTKGVESRKAWRENAEGEYLEYCVISCRAKSASLTDFGGVGDGTTSNTKAFQEAITYLSQYESEGGSQLVVPPGKWITGSFNLTSHFTLHLHKDAVLVASQDESEWPVIEPLPSYGRGRDNTEGGRFISLIFGTNLTDVVITDSCTNTRIEDCYIVSGDDCIAVKSGWDEYGIAFRMPTKQLVIRRLTCISPFSAVIALGSEMSGGIQVVRAEDIVAINSESGVRIKTAVGRGGFVKDIYVRGMTMKTMKWAFWMTGNYGCHADNGYDPYALPVIQNINHHEMAAENVTMAAELEGIPGDPFTGICKSNVTITLAKNVKKLPWNCTDVARISSRVVPQPCEALADQVPGSVEACNFPEESLPIDNFQVQVCSYRRKPWR
ncbi:probable polygalacturonase [Pyrus x bretschneideri]|uniref:probable polygalacturonase n=1 Tax=Pyrus x bretschneideri TaxID=225117 RepID=UPI00202EC857|nr:probable polygalacturonase [Pyrus x bretschneideri]